MTHFIQDKNLNTYTKETLYKLLINGKKIKDIQDEFFILRDQNIAGNTHRTKNCLQ